jgi:hypothetical protein
LAEKHFPDSKQIRHQSMALLAHARVGHEFAKKLETLRHDFAGEKGHACDIDGQMAAVAYRQGARVPQFALPIRAVPRSWN